MKTKVMHAAIIILNTLCAASIYDGLKVDNWYENLIGYLVAVVPLALIAFFLSKHIKTKNKKFGLVGMSISILLLILPMIQIAYLFLSWYIS